MTTTTDDALHVEVIRLRIANTSRPVISQAVYEGTREAFPDLPALDAYERSQVITRNIPIQTNK